MAVLSAIDTALLPFVSEKKKSQELWDNLKRGAVPILGRMAMGIGKTLVKKHVGIDPGELVAGIGEPKNGVAADIVTSITETAAVEIERVADEAMAGLVDRFNKGNAAIDDFRSRLEAAIAALEDQVPLPLFVIIDELDRCRPSYAIALLERVKHLFEVENVAFIFATNADQLQHSVEGAYGPSFDGFRYLGRFFERTYQLHAPNPNEFILAECQRLDLTRCRSPVLDPANFLVEVAKGWRLTLREAKQFVDILETLIAVWPKDVALDLVSSSALSISYLRSGKADWEAARSIHPDPILAIPASHDRRYYSDEPRPGPTFSVVHAFEEVMRTQNSLDAAIKLGESDRSSQERRYAFDTFVPEWDNKSVNRGAKSVPSSLSLAISNAGRLI